MFTHNVIKSYNKRLFVKMLEYYQKCLRYIFCANWHLFIKSEHPQYHSRYIAKYDQKSLLIIRLLGIIDWPNKS